MEKFTSIIFGAISALIASSSPELREFIAETIDKWERKAASTSNPVDDVLVKIVKTLLGL